MVGGWWFWYIQNDIIVGLDKQTEDRKNWKIGYSVSVLLLLLYYMLLLIIYNFSFHSQPSTLDLYLLQFNEFALFRLSVLLVVSLVAFAMIRIQRDGFRLFVRMTVSCVRLHKLSLRLYLIKRLKLIYLRAGIEIFSSECRPGQETSLSYFHYV